MKVFWDALIPFNGVCHHWGKYLPQINGTYGGTKYDENLLEKAFPNMIKWNEKRKEHDKYGLFLTDYWKTNLVEPIEKAAACSNTK